MNFPGLAGVLFGLSHKLSIFSLIVVLCLLPACSGKIINETKAKPAQPSLEKTPTSVPAWLGNASRSFYGTGPWSKGPLEVVWEVETDWITGRLHEDPWGGSSWPGEPSCDE